MNESKIELTERLRAEGRRGSAAAVAITDAP